MNFAWNYLLVLIWLGYMISTGVWLFSRGFLLSRISKTDTNSCRRLTTNASDEYFLSEEIVQEIFKDVNATSNLCLPQKTKVVILVIDAMKYDFGVWNDSIGRGKALPYENKLPVMHRLLKQSPENTRLMRFMADPPTTTLQRLKGLTTGSLPTFIDIGSNFASPEINEDNIIDQMVKNELPVVFMGDSTWTDLYPKRFMRSYSYPSFDIFDLDTVDNNIQKHLPKELNKNDWQVLIAHFLGVDHCGHKYGPLHEEMERKLSEMNNVIESVIAQMDNDTTLFVIGDHGMTINGDHGGESDDETNALLFAYSKHHNFVSSEFGSDNKTLQQIDLVPTLATILGVPIPYSNLGLVNFNLVPDVVVPFMSKFQVLLLHAWQNAKQLHNYFHNYALENLNTFDEEQLDKMTTDFTLLAHRVKTIYNENAFKSIFGDINKHLRGILRTCRELWIKFDPSQMSQGLLLTFLPIFFGFLLINNSKTSDFYTMFTSKEMGYTYMLNFAAGTFGYRFYKSFNFRSEEQGLIFFTNILSSVILVYHTMNNWTNIANNWSSLRRFSNMPTRIIMITTVSVFFSNSFVIQEAKILSFLLGAVLLLMAYELLQKNIKTEFKTRFRVNQFLKTTALKLILASILAIALIRITYAFFRCREEQGNCLDFSNNNNGFGPKTYASGKTYIVAVVLIVLYTTLTRLYLRSCGNLTGNAINVLLARYGPTVASICAGGHILLSNSTLKNIQRSHVDALALVIFALLFIQIIVVSVRPLMTYVMPPKPKNIITVENEHSIVPEIFKKIKQMHEGDPAQRRPEIPVVYGLATIYSSFLITFGIFLSMVLIVLLEAKASMGIVLCMAVAAILLSVNSILRYSTATSFETCIQPSFKAIVAWFLLAHFCFFATSHQTTLSQIDWRAAFVGRSACGIGQSNFISGLLVICNTFAGQIFFFCMYGLLATETFSVFALFPNLIKTNHNRENRNRFNDATKTLSDISNESVGFDMTRGELTLFENELDFLGASFKLASQFFLLQGLKIFCAMLACTIHCRHLMVWKIFAPRFIYEALATFVTLPAISIGFLLILRIHLGVDGLITRINKIK